MTIKSVEVNYKSRNVEEHFGDSCANICTYDGKEYNACMIVDKISDKEYSITISADCNIDDDDLDYIAYETSVAFKLKGQINVIKGIISI